MSAILSADDLNDFISPGVACIKPVETLPQQQPAEEPTNEYEVTTEEKVTQENPPPAQISLTDCLACSGCVTSAEAVLVSLQSHSEVLDTLDKYKEFKAPWLGSAGESCIANGHGEEVDDRIFVATVSPQSRSSLAATYNISEREAGFLIAQLLSGPHGLRAGGKHGSGFTWILDTNALREACLVASAEEVQQSIDNPAEGQKKPVLNSTCPGWVCYAEKTHPHILPHLSKLKSPQALSGTLVKSVLARKFGVPPEKVWHLSVMPCFDKKLEASRQELTSHTWHGQEGDAIRDVDCVITARELLMLAESRDISFPCLPKQRLSKQFAPSFPDATINRFLFGRSRGQKRKNDEVDPAAIGTSGGYLHHVLKTQQARNPGSSIKVHRGRNADVADYTVVSAEGKELFRAARYYGFRNIQNLVRRLKPAKQSRMPGATRRPMGGARKPGAASAGAASEGDYAYVEVMACPGGCTNGGGQVKVGDVLTLRQVGGTGIENGSAEQEVLPAQKEWLAKVDEAYWSAESEDLDDAAAASYSSSLDGDGDVEMDAQNGGVTEPDEEDLVDGIDRKRVRKLFEHWSASTGVELSRLLHTTFRAVESDVGKSKSTDTERVAGLAVQVGGGW